MILVKLESQIAMYTCTLQKSTRKVLKFKKIYYLKNLHRLHVHVQCCKSSPQVQKITLYFVSFNSTTNKIQSCFVLCLNYDFF